MQVEFGGFPEIGLERPGETFGKAGKGVPEKDRKTMKRSNALLKDRERGILTVRGRENALFRYGGVSGTMDTNAQIIPSFFSSNTRTA